MAAKYERTFEIFASFDDPGAVAVVEVMVHATPAEDDAKRGNEGMLV